MTAWLVAFALLVQCGIGASAALGMWIEVHASGRMAQAHCSEHGASGKQDRSSDRKGHDHEHCLLCNAAAADCPASILPLLSAAPQGSVAPDPTPAVPAHRKVVHANAPRGPPGPA
jgi:hypothetical protein